ncbi:cation:proton antiporter [Paraflavitalea sp. CAU 1676]|uniref:cation:proton antiporter domain-containing protein n=1 Tax=Paraflavitalea sp. CAU 1676 TaxID=3032598 RepID=UPI0023DB9776|nr:cation:proton antiporter [Paraflavitalea sp. CAU 1676]MDF2189943.1 cation:proton antiporter [Paraflavitalea sp. CAU 1676]
MHLPDLIVDLALILGVAGITTLIFRRLKQPVVLGYILAGLLVGHNVPWTPTISDEANVEVWAKIGVVFLLFNLGLEFSFKKLVRIGGTASITAIVEIAGMLLVGFLVGRLMGWSTMDSIFLGGILSISSTTIIIRAFEELGIKSQRFAGIVFGVLIVEDLVAILLMVILSTLAVSQQFAGGEMLISLAKLVFFLAVWFLAGIFLLPTFLQKARKLMSEETLLIVSLGLCLGMVVLATSVGFSPELGAFVMGSILAETTMAERIEHLVKPVKDLFAAVFFVSVGIIFDPGTIIEYKWPVLILTVATIIGKVLSTTAGALLSGQPLKQSLQSGMSLAQIGEFSFIIASLGLTLNVTSGFLYPIAVAISAITTFTTPYLIKFSEPLYHWIEARLPMRWKVAINQYGTGAQTIQAESDWKIVLRSYITIMVINSVIVLAIVLLSQRFLLPLIASSVNSETVAAVITCFITLVAIAPFLWALAIRRLHSFAYANLWLDKKYNHGPLVMLEVVRNVLLVVLVGFLVDRLFTAMIAVLAVLPVIIVVLLIFSRRLQSFYSRIEKRFLSNLHEREGATHGLPHLSPWDAHIAYFTIQPESSVIGNTLQELAWREQYGVNIASIERGKRTVYAPTRFEKIFPYDKISVIGTDVQLEKFRKVVETEVIPEEKQIAREDITLNKLIIDEHTALRGQSIRNSGIREKVNGLVVGIERNGERILNPDSTTIFEWDDVVWIVGDRKQLHQLVKE